jgi:hypothetical protein
LQNRKFSLLESRLAQRLVVPLAKRALTAAMAKLPAPSGFHVVTGTKLYTDMPIAQITAVIAKEIDGKVVSYREMHSR